MLAQVPVASRPGDTRHYETRVSSCDYTLFSAVASSAGWTKLPSSSESGDCSKLDPTYNSPRQTVAGVPAASPKSQARWAQPQSAPLGTAAGHAVSPGSVSSENTSACLRVEVVSDASGRVVAKGPVGLMGDAVNAGEGDRSRVRCCAVVGAQVIGIPSTAAAFSALGTRVPGLVVDGGREVHSVDVEAEGVMMDCTSEAAEESPLPGAGTVSAAAAVAARGCVDKSGDQIGGSVDASAMPRAQHSRVERFRLLSSARSRAEREVRMRREYTEILDMQVAYQHAYAYGINFSTLPPMKDAFTSVMSSLSVRHISSATCPCRRCACMCCIPVSPLAGWLLPGQGLHGESGAGGGSLCDDGDEQEWEREGGAGGLLCGCASVYVRRLRRRLRCQGLSLPFQTASSYYGLDGAVATDAGCGGGAAGGGAASNGEGSASVVAKCAGREHGWLHDRSNNNGCARCVRGDPCPCVQKLACQNNHAVVLPETKCFKRGLDIGGAGGDGGENGKVYMFRAEAVYAQAVLSAEVGVLTERLPLGACARLSLPGTIMEAYIDPGRLHSMRDYLGMAPVPQGEDEDEDAMVMLMMKEGGPMSYDKRTRRQHAAAGNGRTYMGCSKSNSNVTNGSSSSDTVGDDEQEWDTCPTDELSASSDWEDGLVSTQALPARGMSYTAPVPTRPHFQDARHHASRGHCHDHDHDHGGDADDEEHVDMDGGSNAGVDEGDVDFWSARAGDSEGGGWRPSGSGSYNSGGWSMSGSLISRAMRRNSHPWVLNQAARAVGPTALRFRTARMGKLLGLNSFYGGGTAGGSLPLASAQTVSKSVFHAEMSGTDPAFRARSAGGRVEGTCVPVEKAAVVVGKDAGPTGGPSCMVFVGGRGPGQLVPTLGRAPRTWAGQRRRAGSAGGAATVAAAALSLSAPPPRPSPPRPSPSRV